MKFQITRSESSYYYSDRHERLWSVLDASAHVPSRVLVSQLASESWCEEVFSFFEREADTIQPGVTVSALFVFLTTLCQLHMLAV
jgi:hypothetical protein